MEGSEEKAFQKVLVLFETVSILLTILLIISDIKVLWIL